MSGQYRFCRLFFGKGLAAVYGLAFLSIARQVRGLLGEHGVLPVRLFLHAPQGPALSPLHAPTVFWFGASDAALLSAAVAGVLLAIAALSGLGGALVWGALWALYLSFVSVGQAFYQYSQDLLLLEVGFLWSFASGRLLGRDRDGRDLPAVLVWLLRVLLFRVLLGAGIAKLRSDPCWSSLTCLPAYLETQPYPTVLSYYAHGLPMPVQSVATFVVLFSEVVVPFGLFGPRALRRAAGGATIAVRGLVMLFAGGSFGSFLVALAALACLDDECLARLGLSSRLVGSERPEAPSRARRRVLSALAVVTVGLALLEARAFLRPMPGGDASVEPFHLVNLYGAVDPVEPSRSDVVFEGTMDDVALGPGRFTEYALPCAPGDPDRAPCLPALNPHRLDLRLWQAALGDFRREEWVVRVVDALLRGDPAVTGLFARNPFAAKPPRFVRALRYRYRFSTNGEEPYWRREPIDEFIRPIALEDPALYEYLFHKGWIQR